MNTSNEVSNVISYLNQDKMTFKSTSEIVSAVNIIDRVTTNNQNINNEVWIIFIKKFIFFLIKNLDTFKFLFDCE